MNTSMRIIPCTCVATIATLQTMNQEALLSLLTSRHLEFYILCLLDQSVVQVKQIILHGVDTQPPYKVV